MADPADEAQGSVEAFTKAALHRPRKGPFDHLIPIGICHWCKDPVDQGLIHCRPKDNGCEEDHSKLMRNGR